MMMVLSLYSARDMQGTKFRQQDIDVPLNCNVVLKNKQLWKEFSAHETEMIITKSGRRMFPSINVQMQDLSPSTLYTVILEMEPISRTRYKYSASGGWFPSGSEEAHSLQRYYVHPESPAKGEYWMSQPISFGRLKLTNTIAPPVGQIVLSSMHKYQPKIIIAKTSDIREIHWAQKAVVTFPETQFIAVTAYQNEKVTRLKIDNNPFAKGFRENGQAKCKRKKVNMDNVTEKLSNKNEEASEDLISVDDRLSPTFSCSSSTSSPTSYDSSSTPQSNPLDQSSFAQTDSLSRCPIERYSPSSYPLTSPVCSYQSDYRPVVLNALHRYPVYYPYLCYSPTMWNPNAYPQYVLPLPKYPQETSMRDLPTEEEVKEKPKKLTDFSIRAITGHT